MQSTKQMFLKNIYAIIALVFLSSTVVAQELSPNCSTPDALQIDAFTDAMTFTAASNKGNMLTSS